MFIKFTYNTQKRKTNASLISNMEELKAKALEIFGNEVEHCDFMHEDEDKELVSLKNNEDLETCFQEAQANELKTINIYIELSSDKTQKARSLSKKRAQPNQEIGVI